MNLLLNQLMLQFIFKNKIISTKSMMIVNGIEKDDFFIETHLNRANPVARNIKKTEQELVIAKELQQGLNFPRHLKLAISN